MRTAFLITTLAALVLGGSLPMKSQQTATVSEKQGNELTIQRIQAGETAAIDEAGKSGNPLFVPYLRQKLKDRRNQGDPVRHARIALARLGETDQLQEVWCRAITDDPKRGLNDPSN